MRTYPQPLMNTAEGKRMENQEVLGLSNMTEVVCFNGGKGWVLVVARDGGLWCGEKTDGGVGLSCPYE